MKVLVTGGAGFIGSHIVSRLLAAGWSVTILDNLSTGRRENLHPQAEFINMDIRSQAIGKVFAEARYDYVVHQAAQTSVPISLQKPGYDCDVNIMGTVNILEACRTTGVKKIVFASSAAIYGDAKHTPIAEDHEQKPFSFYGLSKLTVERYLALYKHNFNLGYVALRYANVYGERQGDAGEGGVVSIFSRKFHSGKGVSIYGDGGQSRDFVYAGDVAEANYQALVSPVFAGVYNISTQTETTVNQLFEALQRISGTQVDKAHEAAREGDIYRSSLANGLAFEQLNWQPMVSLEDGLRRTYRSLSLEKGLPQ